MAHGVNPYGYAFWQSFGPFLLLLITQLIRQDLWFDRSVIKYAFLAGIFGIALPNQLIYFTIKHVPSGLLTVIANLVPIFIYPLALLFKDEKFKLKRIILVIVGMIGVCLVIIPNQHHLSIDLGASWIYFALLIPLSYAFSAVYISRFCPKDGNVLSYSLWMLMFSTLCISPLTIIRHGYYPLHIGDQISNLIILEIILSTCGYILLFIILQRVRSVYYSLVNGIAALTGIFYGYFIFNQQLSFYVYIGIFVILFTIFGLTYTQNRK